MVATSAVLVLVSTTLFVGLAARERAGLIDAKARAAAMLVQLLATELGAAIDFGDADGVTARLGDLHENPAIVGAGVWTAEAAEPTASWTSPGAPPLGAPKASDPDGTSSSS